MSKKIPKTREECFAQLDAMLSDEELKSFMRMFSDECESPFGYITIHPDHMSSVIIEKYAASLHSKAATSS